MKNFALIGSAGYIAPRHLQAIHATGNRLVAACDPHDSVGILDRYFPDARFFPEIERFDRFVEKQRRLKSGDRVDVLSVCSPNYLHDAHVRLGLRVYADVICEKPTTITPWNIDALMALESEFGKRVYTVLQLRLLPALADLKRRFEADPARTRADIVLSYVTRRGPWYHVSWKGNSQKSGGIAMNIGIHFFDMLMWIFGPCQRHELHLHERDKMAGLLDLEWADVRWLLSVDKADLPEGHLENGKPAFRSITIDGEELDFSTGFADLHTAVYRDILAGGGFGLEVARPSVQLVHDIRHSDVVARPDYVHPQLERVRQRVAARGKRGAGASPSPEPAKP